MLVLTRKSSESICIGDEVEIVITDITKGAVKIGIKAPKDTRVYRKEVYDRILLENQEASQAMIDNSALVDLNVIINKRINKNS